MQIGPCVWQIARILAHEFDVVAEWPMCLRLVGRYRGPRRFRVCGGQTRNSVLRQQDRSANPAATASSETREYPFFHCILQTLPFLLSSLLIVFEAECAYCFRKHEGMKCNSNWAASLWPGLSPKPGYRRQAAFIKGMAMVHQICLFTPDTCARYACLHRLLAKDTPGNMDEYHTDP